MVSFHGDVRLPEGTLYYYRVTTRYHALPRLLGFLPAKSLSLPTISISAQKLDVQPAELPEVLNLGDRAHGKASCDARETKIPYVHPCRSAHVYTYAHAYNDMSTIIIDRLIHMYI